MKSLEASSDWLGVVPFRKCRASLLLFQPQFFDGWGGCFLLLILVFLFLKRDLSHKSGGSDRLIYNQSLIL